jgi:hypothetical protein
VVTANDTITRWVGKSESNAQCPPNLTHQQLIECLAPDRKVTVELKYKTIEQTQPQTNAAPYPVPPAPAPQPYPANTYTTGQNTMGQNQPNQDPANMQPPSVETYPVQQYAAEDQQQASPPQPSDDYLRRNLTTGE